MNMQILALLFFLATVAIPMASLALDSWLKEAGERRDANRID